MTITSRIRHFLVPKPVPNTGSQLRDHQANERTFLSWTRMGLVFAAMALALSRLGMIDHVFNKTYLNGNGVPPKGAMNSGPGSGQKDANDNHNKGNRNGTKEGSRVVNTTTDDHFASQICQAISAWSFGYGFFRYVSVRKNLLQGNFVLALWGPVFITTGSLVSLGVILRKDYFGRPVARNG